MKQLRYTTVIKHGQKEKSNPSLKQWDFGVTLAHVGRAAGGHSIKPGGWLLNAPKNTNSWKCVAPCHPSLPRPRRDLPSVYEHGSSA